jgi:benzaldehyde dehydrogenase (NAD)
MSATFDRLNPMTGALASTSPAMSVAQANAVADTAQAALPGWSALGPNARRALLTKAADALEAKADAFVDAMMSEIGATEGWARFNLMLAAGMVREAAALTTQINPARSSRPTSPAASPWPCASRPAWCWA